MHIRSILASIAIAAALGVSPVLAGGTCTTFTNMKSVGNGHVSRVQTCRNLDQCSPHQFASLSDPVEANVRLPDTHQYSKVRNGEVKKSPIFAGACPV